MAQCQYHLLVAHWNALKDAAARWRRDDGVTTVEVLIIAGVLLAAASALAITFTAIIANRGKHIPAS